MKDSELFQAALDATKALARQYPASHALQSAVEQLEYLADLESGKASDRSLLPRINVGVIAAREVDDMDPNTAELLYKVQARVREMN